MGVSSPEKVSAGVVLILGDRLLTVHGRTTVDGHRRTQKQANVFRENWRGPDGAPPPELRKHRVGHWISMGDGEEIVTSTVTGGGRTVEVSNMLRVTVDDAERIVAAILGGTFVDGTGFPEVTTRALAGLTSGRRVSVQSFEEASSSVQWFTGDYHGTNLKVRFVDGVVTILEVLQFMV